MFVESQTTLKYLKESMNAMTKKEDLGEPKETSRHEVLTLEVKTSSPDRHKWSASVNRRTKPTPSVVYEMIQSCLPHTVLEEERERRLPEYLNFIPIVIQIYKTHVSRS